MGNHGVWADDEISCITINGLQLFIMYTSIGCALKLSSPKHYPNGVHMHVHYNTMLPCGHYQEYIIKREGEYPTLYATVQTRCG